MIHNNGSSEKDLLNDLQEAFLSLRESLSKLSKTAPHQRDYYIKCNNDYKVAIEQYKNRCNKISEVMDELEQIAITIQIKNY